MDRFKIGALCGIVAFILVGASFAVGYGVGACDACKSVSGTYVSGKCLDVEEIKLSED